MEVGTTTYDGTINTVAQGLGIGDSPPGGSGTSLRYQGYLDDVELPYVKHCEEKLVEFLHASDSGVMDTIATTKLLDDDTEAALKADLEKFKASYTPPAAADPAEDEAPAEDAPATEDEEG